MLDGKSVIVDTEHHCFYDTTSVADKAGIALLRPNNIDIAMDAALQGKLRDVIAGNQAQAFASPLDDALRFQLPVPQPWSFRDAYAFLDHVKTCRKARGQDVHPAFFECPAFYFSNPVSLAGGGDVSVPPHAREKLDYELEVAVVIGEDVRDISVKDADDVIAGFMLLNDWSGRKIQAEKELPMMMGPNKSKDFASTAGPWLTTPQDLREQTKQSAKGNHYDIPLAAYVNGEKFSSGNLNTIHYTFAEIIAHMAAGTTIKKGDVIGSGTVGSGCLLELNLTGKLADRWLQEGDEVTLQSPTLGQLRNRVVCL